MSGIATEAWKFVRWSEYPWNCLSFNFDNLSSLLKLAGVLGLNSLALEFFRCWITLLMLIKCNSSRTIASVPLSSMCRKMLLSARYSSLILSSAVLSAGYCFYSFWINMIHSSFDTFCSRGHLAGWMLQQLQLLFAETDLLRDGGTFIISLHSWEIFQVSL